MQQYPLLQTKLYVPPFRPELVSRPSLVERLHAGLRLGRKLTLISTPAGFGKTTLVSEWVDRLRSASVHEGQSGWTVAWLSLDKSDNDLIRFLEYLIAALQTVDVGVGRGVLSALQTPQPPPTEAILTSLINEVAAFAGRMLLVLDDYHLVEAPSIHGALTFLLEHLPAQMHLVLATREDPPLPLSRLRVRAELTELRVADLRFTPSEAAEFLTQLRGLNLSADEVAALESRTEGWIAGLQMAALALQSPTLQGTLSPRGRTDTASFVRAFTGSHRFVLDYLVEEVLQRQPEHVRSFLLQTSILERLCGPLCDAVTRREDSKGMLEALEHSNLFVVPLDDRRQWYRYHQLFADVLQVYLREDLARQLPTLHRRASEWYEQTGYPADAIRHALAAEDFERAAFLIELAWSAMDINYQSATWLGWVKALPDELVRTRPVLSLGYAWALLDGGEMEGVETRLRDAERWLKPADEQAENRSAKMVVVDEAEFRSLPASIASARAYRFLAMGNVPATVEYARRALTLVPENDQVRRTQATALLGLAEYASGDLQSAERSLLDFQASMRQTGDIATAIGITFILANIKLAQGRLREAVSAYQQSLQLVASWDAPLPIGTSDLYRGLSELLYEQGDLEAATQHLLTAQKLGELAASTGWLHRLCVAQARMKQARGDLAGALDLLDEAERLYVRNPLPDVRPVAALRARLWLVQGRLDKALGWARERVLSVNDELSYLREFEHITLARVLIARYRNDGVDSSVQAALGLLERLLQAAEDGRRIGSAIEILILEALAHEARGDVPLALPPLERALTLAEPEGYVQLFVDEGEPIEELLVRMNRQLAGTEGVRRKEYVRRLLAAFGRPKDIRSSPRAEQGVSLQPLVEPLSERELDVLRLLRTELNGPEIARELVVSLNTMRTHTRSIYSKLGVNNRRAAVLRAEELGLL